MTQLLAYYTTVGILSGLFIGWKLHNFVNFDPKDNPKPSMVDLEKAYLIHKHYGLIPSGKPVMYHKLKYIKLYHDKMIEFYNDMITIENDGFNFLDLNL